MNKRLLSAGIHPAEVGVLLAMVLLLSPVSARAQGALVVYCSVEEEWCRAMATVFERQTGVRVAMTRKSAGETYAQVKAEAANPRGDIWWGGTGDPHVQAAGEGLIVEYRSARLGELQVWAVRQWEQTRGRTVGIYSGALGFGFNVDLIKKKGLAEIGRGADPLDPNLNHTLHHPTPHPPPP